MRRHTASSSRCTAPPAATMAGGDPVSSCGPPPGLCRDDHAGSPHLMGDSRTCAVGSDREIQETTHLTPWRSSRSPRRRRTQSRTRVPCRYGGALVASSKATSRCSPTPWPLCRRAAPDRGRFRPRGLRMPARAVRRPYERRGRARPGCSSRAAGQYGTRLGPAPFARLGVRRRLVKVSRPTSGWSSLTDSEVAVVRLVADGLTNREVAERLFVSPHTVSMHLRHVFTKLEITSRVELTRGRVQQDEAA